MSRVLAVIAACLLLCVRAVEADTVQTNVTQLSTSGSYKIRLAAALALSKSKDARAVIAMRKLTSSELVSAMTPMQLL